MLLETRSLLARAQTNRYLLMQLLEQVPDGSWDRRASGDAWSARHHLAHLATIDGVTAALLTSPSDGAYRLDPGLQALRLSAMEAAVAWMHSQLVAAMASERNALARLLGDLHDNALASPVLIDVPGEWPPVRQLSMRAYLATWAEHDADHTAAIRAAIASPPSASDLALAARLGRG